MKWSIYRNQPSLTAIMALVQKSTGKSVETAENVKVLELRKEGNI